MSGEAAASDREPSPAEIRGIVADLFGHRAFIYWLDMLASALLGWAGLAAAVLWRGDIVPALFLTLVSAFAFMRALLFIHEISHFRRGVLPGFTAVWNLLVGVPMLVPSFMYQGTHTDHHKRHLFGTIGDPEYLPLVPMGRRSVVLFLAEMLVVPALLVLRFGLLTPLSWAIPPLRRLVVEKMSALVINKDYRRRPPEGAFRVQWLVLELLGLVWVLGILGLAVSGHLPWAALGLWYAVAALVALVNQYRTLSAHEFANPGDEMSTTEQLLDSINVVGGPAITELLSPVGLRYHALHHLIADLPYHALPEAHRRLMRDLPEGAAYRRSNRSTIAGAVAQLWRRAASGEGVPRSWKKRASE